MLARRGSSISPSTASLRTAPRSSAWRSCWPAPCSPRPSSRPRAAAELAGPVLAGITFLFGLLVALPRASLDRRRPLRRRRRGARLPPLGAPAAGGARYLGPAGPPLPGPGDRHLPRPDPGDGGGDGPGGAARRAGDGDPEIEARSVAQNVSDYIEMNGARTATLAVFAGREPMTAAGQASCSRLAAGLSGAGRRCARSPATAGCWPAPAPSPCRRRRCWIWPRRSAGSAATSSPRSRSESARSSCWARRSTTPRSRRHAGGRLRRRLWAPDRPAGIPRLPGGRPRPDHRRGRRCGRARRCRRYRALGPASRERQAGGAGGVGGFARSPGSAGRWRWSAPGPTPWPACGGGATSPSACSWW